MSAIVFLDTETTGLSLDDDIWEIAAIRREADGSEREYHTFVEHDLDKAARLPAEFRSDHDARYRPQLAAPTHVAAALVYQLTEDKPHIVGAVPNFDTERLARLLTHFGHKPGWHYHLIDVENLAVGYLAGGACTGLVTVPSLPWDSENLSRAVGIDPEQFDRHTAMGDVRWAMAIYDRVMGSAR